MATVLIIEDETTILVLADSVLQSAGYHTLTASSLSQALALLSADQKPDLVFTDISLGDIREAGLQIGQTVRQVLPHAPVLYTSAYALTDGLKEQFVDRSEFLAKPYTDDQMLDAISRLLQSK